jgi:predicted acylesterase/phospholipase RssA/ABC-type phosphate/phosphonate transport system substrate-binding protein
MNRLVLALIVAFAATASSAADDKLAENADNDNVVRVGIVSFDDTAERRERLHSLFRDLAAAASDKLQFRLATGTYADVEHWMQRGLIDLAFVTPGLFTPPLLAGDLNPPDKTDVSLDNSHDLLNEHVRYLANVGLRPAVSAWSHRERKAPGYHDRFRSVALVKKDSSLTTIEDVLDAANHGRLRVLLVSPLSVSGSIAPRYAFAQRGIRLDPLQIEYSHSHSASGRLLAESRTDDEVETVAFVWDDSLRAAPEVAQQLRAIEFPDLDEMVIPQEMVVAHRDFSRADELRKLLLDHQDADGANDFLQPADWRSLRRDVVRWKHAVDRMTADDEDDAHQVTFDEIGRMLLHYARSQGQSPRLALVLSGGGAKCSYQVGAVAAIEEKLATLRDENPDVSLDVNLVVGTSGGAINALPIALGVTKSDEGRHQFADVWQGLDQRDIVRPARLVRANIGLWFALLQAAILLGVLRLLVRDESQRGWWFGAIFALLGAVQMAIAYLDPRPWRFLGHNHWMHHIWLWLTFGSRASAWSLTLIGIVVLLRQAMLLRQGRHVRASWRWIPATLTVGLIGLLLVQIATLLFFQNTLSGGEGMERALATGYPQLIDGELHRRAEQPLDLSDEDEPAERLQSAGRQIIDRRLLRRDLVITGSRLTPIDDDESELPNDLYFYIQADADADGLTKSEEPPFGPRGISLVARPELALDVVLGSGSIFPVFPARPLADFPKEGMTTELIDGGFAHNSPLEAAVLWGATHILLIEATPDERVERHNFLTNAVASFEHLYEQSQLLDARSRGRVAVFSLSPQPPHLCVLDFADNLIEDSIERGYHDVAGKSFRRTMDDASDAVIEPLFRRSLGEPRFRKELGEPVFVDLSPSAGAIAPPQ